MSSVFGEKPVYVSGKFEGIQKEEVWTYLLATGAYGTMGKSAAQAYLSADPSDAKLVATKKPIYTLADLPLSLDGYLERLQQAVAFRKQERARDKHRSFVTHLGFGPPLSEPQIAQLEASLGYALPDEVKCLMRQWNGLSCVVAQLKSGQQVELGQTPLPYAALADSAHPIWQDAIEWLVATVGIPTWEEIFLRPQARRMCNHSDSYDPKEVLKIGALKVKAGVLFPRLFAFDLFHHYGGAALYLDPTDNQAKIIYCFDYFADLTSAQPVSLRMYMESLAAGIWGRIAHAGLRPIRPVSKTAWPTYIRNIHGAPYVFVELK